MSKKINRSPVFAADVAPDTKPSRYPEPFASRVAGRERRRLGDHFGLGNFGVNLTRLAPNAISALRHSHSRQDEFRYVLKGQPTLYTDDGQFRLGPGMCVGFPAGAGNANNLVNETSEEVIYLEIGDRTPDDSTEYPDDDIRAVLVDGVWQFSRKDGTPF
jgi:uncharacterized cupin superfamily protein